MAPVQRQRHRRAAWTLAVGKVQRGAPDTAVAGRVIMQGATVGNQSTHAYTPPTQANDKLPESERVPASDVYMMAPAVASKMLDAIARTHGFNFEETLTGFKWAGNKVTRARHCSRGGGAAAKPACAVAVRGCCGPDLTAACVGARRSHTCFVMRARRCCFRTSLRSGSASATCVVPAQDRT